MIAAPAFAGMPGLERAIADPEGRRHRSLAISLAGSLGVHLLPALLLLQFADVPPEVAAPIPVQLVFEAPLPAPPPETAPPSGRLASEDIGETAVAEAVLPPPRLTSALPNPTPPEATSPPQAPAPVPPKHASPPHPAHQARIPGSAASRSEYLAYCMSLIRRHFGLLPPSFLAGRRGATLLSIQVLGDGTIARVAVARGSPYPDIDARIEAAVTAVRRFPPVPQWFQGTRMGLTLQVGYPEGL